MWRDTTSAVTARFPVPAREFIPESCRSGLITGWMGGPGLLRHQRVRDRVQRAERLGHAGISGQLRTAPLDSSRPAVLDDDSRLCCSCIAILHLHLGFDSPLGRPVEDGARPLLQLLVSHLFYAQNILAHFQGLREIRNSKPVGWVLDTVQSRCSSTCCTWWAGDRAAVSPSPSEVSVRREPVGLLNRVHAAGPDVAVRVERRFSAGREPVVELVRRRPLRRYVGSRDSSACSSWGYRPGGRSTDGSRGRSSGSTRPGSAAALFIQILAEAGTDDLTFGLSAALAAGVFDVYCRLPGRLGTWLNYGRSAISGADFVQPVLDPFSDESRHHDVRVAGVGAITVASGSHAVARAGADRQPRGGARHVRLHRSPQRPLRRPLQARVGWPFQADSNAAHKLRRD